MSETGWPLIPRGVLPAPVPVTRPAQRRPLPRAGGGHTDPGRQLSIFGAETIEPSPADLAGLLAGPGRLDRMGGTARVSVRVDAAWRVHVLVHEVVRRGLVVTWLPIEIDQIDNPDTRDGDPPGITTDPADDEVARSGSTTDAIAAGAPEAAFFEVRTAYSSRLNGLARGWPAAADQLFLSGPRLRLWVAAAGGPLTGGYALGLDSRKDPAIVDAALVRAGLAGTVSDDGRYYLILGRKRLVRLAELVGERPNQAPPALWPSGPAA